MCQDLLVGLGAPELTSWEAHYYGIATQELLYGYGDEVLQLENMLTKHIAQLHIREQQLGSTLDASLLGIGCACRAAVVWIERLHPAVYLAI